METKNFSFLQLFNVVEGRISTNIDDAQRILNHLFDTSVQVVEVPSFLKKLREVNPPWFALIKDEIDILKKHNNGDVLKVIDSIRKNYNYSLAIPKIIVRTRPINLSGESQENQFIL